MMPKRNLKRLALSWNSYKHKPVLVKKPSSHRLQRVMEGFLLVKELGKLIAARLCFKFTDHQDYLALDLHLGGVVDDDRFH